MTKARKPPVRVDIGSYFQPDEHENDIDFLMKVPDAEVETAAQERGLPLMSLPLTAIAPDPHQLRRLPHPDDLVQMAEEGDRAATNLLAGLRELGQSLVEQGQLQPAIVYPDTNPLDPEVTHRLLHGQRRWSAAWLTGLNDLWIVEVHRPSEVQRIMRQFDENERRKNLTDIERAWALSSLKEALQNEAGADVSWAVIEDAMQISPPRRKDLLRLLRFSDEGQGIILRYGWPEWTLRPLHMAISSGDIEPDDATHILQQLSLEDEVKTAVVAKLVKAFIAQQASETEPSEPEASQELIRQSNQVSRRMRGVRHSLNRLVSQVALIRDEEALVRLHDEAQLLQRSLRTLLQDL